MDPRNRRPGVLVCALLVGLVFLSARVRAQTAAGASEASTFPEQLFSKRQLELSLASGVLFSPFIATHGRPTINYTLTSFQVGYMLSDLKGDGWWRGNFEVAGEALASIIYEGPGGYIAGGTVWLRYNLLPRGWTVIAPYVQVGGGMVSTDIDHSIVGEPFNFNLGLSVGLRCFLSRHWALSLEYRYQHISNANIAEHNLGINADGPVLGVACFF